MAIAWSVLSLIHRGIIEAGLAGPVEIDQLLENIKLDRTRPFRGYVPYIFMQTIARAP